MASPEPLDDESPEEKEEKIECGSAMLVTLFLLGGLVIAGWVWYQVFTRIF